jgi:flagellar basal body-associated protein FliL
MNEDKERVDGVKKRKRRNLPRLDQASSVHFIMLLLTVVVYIVFLSIQQFLFSFEGLRNKIIIINVLLAAGLAMEVAYFIWEIKKRQTKNEESAKNTKSDKMSTNKES